MLQRFCNTIMCVSMYVCGVTSKVLKPTCVQRKVTLQLYKTTALYRDRAYVSVWWKNEGTPGHKRFMFLYPRYCFALQGQRMVTLSKLCKCICVSCMSPISPCSCKKGYSIFTCTRLQWNLSIKGTSLIRTLSAPLN